jgi:hypothetical protein
MYLSPPLAILAARGVFVQNRGPYFKLMLLFLLQFVGSAAFLQWLVPYQYYYARYLLSELIPAGILVAIAGLVALRASVVGRRVATLLAGTAAAYFCFFSVLQWRGIEADGAYPALAEIAKHLGSDDLLFIKRGSFQRQADIRTPLIYLFDKRVVMYENDLTIKKYANASRKSAGSFGGLFVLSSIENDSSSLELVSKTLYREGHFEKAQVVPTRFSTVIEMPLLLSRIRETGNEDKTSNESDGFYLIKEGFHDDGVWTKGSGILTGFSVDLNSKRFIVIETWGWNPYRFEPEKLELKVSFADHTVHLHHQEGLQYFFEIPSGIREITELGIHSTTFVPKELGINEDSRRLGVDFKSIAFE